MRAVIICGGDVGGYIKDYVKKGDLVICADSGYDRAKKYGIIPDVVLGDMDSVAGGDYPVDAIVYPTRKDFTDSELAVMYAIDHGYKSALLFGMIGTRMDHSLANLTLLQRFEEGAIINANNEIYFVRNSITLAGKPGDTISIIPYPGDAGGVTTKGLDYPLFKGKIPAGTTLGISNVMTENECTITLEEGTAFVIRSADE